MCGVLEVPLEREAWRHSDPGDFSCEARRFYRAHIMGGVGDLTADVTISVKLKAKHVVCSVAQHAQALGDTDMGLRVEDLNGEAESPTLQHDTSTDASADMNEV